MNKHVVCKCPTFANQLFIVFFLTILLILFIKYILNISFSDLTRREIKNPYDNNVDERFYKKNIPTEKKDTY